MNRSLKKQIRRRPYQLRVDTAFEAVVRACADLAKWLLHAGPRLKILAASREPLQLFGEVTYQVPALSAPQPDDADSASELMRFEAVRLFVERAIATQRDFRAH